MWPVLDQIHIMLSMRYSLKISVILSILEATKTKKLQMKKSRSDMGEGFSIDGDKHRVSNLGRIDSKLLGFHQDALIESPISFGQSHRQDRLSLNPTDKVASFELRDSVYVISELMFVICILNQS